MNENPNTIVATIGGKERRFLLKAGSVYIAQRRHGFDTSHLVIDAKNIQTLGYAYHIDLLWLASLRYEPDVSAEDFAFEFDLSESEEILRLAQRVMEASGDVVQAAAKQNGSKKKRKNPSASTP